MWSALRRRGREKAAGAESRPSERLRIPHPLIKRRLPSGRGATEQPNATSDGDTALTPMFWLVLVATGVAAGLFGAGLMFLLFTAEHLAFGYHAGVGRPGGPGRRAGSPRARAPMAWTPRKHMCGFWPAPVRTAGAGGSR